MAITNPPNNDNEKSPTCISVLGTEGIYPETLSASTFTSFCTSG